MRSFDQTKESCAIVPLKCPLYTLSGTILSVSLDVSFCPALSTFRHQVVFSLPCLYTHFPIDLPHSVALDMDINKSTFTLQISMCQAF
jgi:hypothetical protein